MFHQKTFTNHSQIRIEKSIQKASTNNAKIEPKVAQKASNIYETTYAKNMDDFLMMFNEKVVQNVAKMEPKGSPKGTNKAPKGVPKPRLPKSHQKVTKMEQTLNQNDTNMEPK